MLPRLSLCFLSLILLCSVAEGGISCLDNDNKPVDWFIVYKLPVKYQGASGLGKKWPFPPHMYMDSRNPTFKLIKSSLNETTQSAAYTLQQAYSNHKSQEVGYILYNDEKPLAAGGGWTESHGHTKGVSIFDNSSGVWLVHSVPKYPPPTNASYLYPDNGVYYGQHMICVSLRSSSDVAVMGNQLMYNEPWIYDSNLPSALNRTYPVMNDVLRETRTKNVSSVEMLTTNSAIFLSFAKNRHFNNDLYAELVAPTLKCNLSTETWQNGASSENLPSYCNQTYKVENIRIIQNLSLSINYTEHMDHSKFAVCQTDSNGKARAFVCIGDINRQTHQMVRGGGTLCFVNVGVNKQYLGMINSVEQCKATAFRFPKGTC